MRKKAALGCALIHNPPVLFLDEPLEGVDPVSGDVIRRLLTRFVGSDSTVLFSSHVMELVEQVCDHVSIIDKGKIVVTGTIDEVRGGKTLQRAFIDLVGPRAADKEVLSWLGSSPRRSRCTPLRTRGLAVGLLAASFTGFWPLANVIGLLGVTVGLASGAFGVIVAVVAVVLQVMFCIALSRFMTTSLASMLRSRRGRDLAAFMIIPLFALYEFFTQVVPKAVSEGKITAASFTGFDSWMRWLPPGLAAHAIQDASGGRPGMAFARLGALAAVIVVFVWLWVRSLGRALVTADTTTQSSRVRGTRLPLAGLGLRGTVAARFWLYQRREPLSLVYWALVAVITAAPSASSVFGHKHHPAVILASAVFGTAFVGIFHANSAGLTGPAFVLEATALGSSRDLRAYFSGQNLVLWRSRHGSRGDAGRPGRDWCRPRAGRPVHCGAALPDGQAGRRSCARARTGLRWLPDWQPPHPGGHRGAGRAGDRRCHAGCERAGRDPDRGDAAMCRRVRFRARSHRCAAGREGSREHAARNVPGSTARGNVTVTRSHNGAICAATAWMTLLTDVRFCR